MHRHTSRTALALLPSLVARAQSSYSYRDLGMQGGSLAPPCCVNNAGQGVGYSNLASTFTTLYGFSAKNRRKTTV